MNAPLFVGAFSLTLLASTKVCLPAQPEQQANLTQNGRTFRGALYSPMPAYPFRARLHKEAGRGLFLLTLRPNGTVVSVAVLRSTGDPDLNIAAAQALIRWRFRPGLYEKVRVPVNFHMRTRVNGNTTILN
jgi:TonB family protein